MIVRCTIILCSVKTVTQCLYGSSVEGMTRSYQPLIAVKALLSTPRELEFLLPLVTMLGTWWAILSQDSKKCNLVSKTCGNLPFVNPLEHLVAALQQNKNCNHLSNYNISFPYIKFTFHHVSVPFCIGNAFFYPMTNHSVIFLKTI